MNEPIFGYENIALTATSVVFSSQQSNFTGQMALNPLTYEGWKPQTMPAYCQIDNGTVKAVDYFAIAGRGLVGLTVTAQHSSDGVTWTDIDDYTLTQNVFIIKFATVTARYFKFVLSGATVPFIISAYFGKALVMPLTIYGGHTPAALARQSVIRPATSEGGQWLGRTVIRQAYKTSVDFKHLHADWYRENFDPFVLAARDRPFFFAWRPNDYPYEVVYGWTEKDIIPSNTGKKDFMSVGFDITGWGG